MGRVEIDRGQSVLVRFEHGYEECEKSQLVATASPAQLLRDQPWSEPLELVTRLQADCIRSVNDTWGVFSRSSIALLPHQLWVCKTVNSTWTTRWLVADDVGLGKTIEAGLILWPLLSRGTVKRLLIICPASLVTQWQERLHSMFDIAVRRYSPEEDTERNRFWELNDHVVGSLQTLRDNRKGRHERLLGSMAWDMVIVDEAHHLNDDEAAGPTLGFRLIRSMLEAGKIESMVFFTGTPHRGKTYNFLSLIQLLRPDLFSPKRPIASQLSQLSQVMIRNNKLRVTDLKGKPLFHRPTVQRHRFSYNAQESEFYALLTDFILTGRAYAGGLNNERDSRAVELVLIAMQKLASSSVAAILRALRRRLGRRLKVQSNLKTLREQIMRLDSLLEEGEDDQRAALEEQILELAEQLALCENEEPFLERLIAVASRIEEETKIREIVRLLETELKDRQVLFFTEYKATQSLLLSALNRKFGDHCAAFINGDDRAEDVILRDGRNISVPLSRSAACEGFLAGRYRFLVSTEAGGEGIDLQASCHTLVHVDLPWNPMRLHQRVGRLNRYGQAKPVDVFIVHNPDTVESKIWAKLDEKLSSIQQALSSLSDDPEDLMELVLGMSGPRFFEGLFARAQARHEKLESWFDSEAATFGGQDVLTTVQQLVGNASRFDYQRVARDLPPLDLPDLKPFLLNILQVNHRRPTEKDGFSFKTPADWTREAGVFDRYEGLVFDRSARGSDAHRKVVGVGLKLFDRALRAGRELEVVAARVPGLETGIFVFRISDRVTVDRGMVRQVLVAIEWRAGSETFLRDWELLQLLNSLTLSHFRTGPADVSDLARVLELAEKSKREVERNLEKFSLPFRVPEVEFGGVIWPG